MDAALSVRISQTILLQCFIPSLFYICLLHTFIVVYFAGIRRTMHLKILARSQKALSFCASSLVFSFSATPLQNIRWKCPFPNPTVDANEILNTEFCNHSEPSAVTCLDLWINELRPKLKRIIFLVTFMWNAAFIVFL